MSNFSSAISKRYDELSGQECCLSCGAALSLAKIRQGDICLDRGCGKGLDVLRMATMTGPAGHAYGIDISEGMMGVARENALKMGLKNVSFVRSELEKISLSDNLADVLISNCTINHSLAQDIVWLEIARILKPGGTVVVSDIYALDEVPAEFRNDPEAVAECWAGAVSRVEYLKNILKSGLSSIEILEESAPYEKGRIRVCSFTVRAVKPGGQARAKNCGPGCGCQG